MPTSPAAMPVRPQIPSAQVPQGTGGTDPAAEMRRQASTSEKLLRPVMPELDTIRGVAVLLVLLFHGFGSEYGLQGLSGLPRLFVAATLPGWVGVNLFFVLSGFLITGILLDTKERPDYFRRFYFRRALRILPVYYAVLVLLVVAARTGWSERQVGWPFIAFSFVYLSNMSLLFGVPMQYGVLWTLSVEEHFYLLWPTVTRRISRRGLMLCGELICAACLALRILYAVRGYSFGMGYTWLVADGLAMGAILACVAREPQNSRRRVRQVCWLAFAVSIGGFLLGARFGIFLNSRFLGATLRETVLNLFFVGVVSLTLLLGSSPLRAVVNRPVLQFFGRISYGLYLVHMLVFEVSNHLLNHWIPTLPPDKGNFSVMILRFVVGFGFTVAVATLSREYFEEPFLRLKDRFEKEARPAEVAVSSAT